MTISGALAEAARRLAATSQTPRLDAELLMAHTLGIGREALLLGDMRGEAPASFEALVARRARHEPVAYITGSRAFWTIELAVTPATLIPRSETETLIEAALAHFRDRGGPDRILDLGTGSGALLLAALAEWPDASGVGVDASEGAMAVAQANAARLGLADRAAIVHGGWEWAANGGFELVLCNPPYVETGAMLRPDVIGYEPASALFAGEDGLDDFRLIAPRLRLPAGGVACLEIGASQGAAVSALFGEHGFATRMMPDLAGRDRCVIVTHPC